MTLLAGNLNEKLCTLDSWLSKATLSVCGFTAEIMDFLCNYIRIRCSSFQPRARTFNILTFCTLRLYAIYNNSLLWAFGFHKQMPTRSVSNPFPFHKDSVPFSIYIYSDNICVVLYSVYKYRLVIMVKQKLSI
jgi:hypothetical protein